MKIKNIIGRELLDSRGNPTVEVDVILENGIVGRSMVPSGASVGSKEALELRDNDLKRFSGKGVRNAVNNINTVIRKNLIGADVENQMVIDNMLIRLDGTKNKANLGANAILGVSIAVFKANLLNLNIPIYKAFNKDIKLPLAMFNIINGGLHAFNNLSFQEFMIVPKANNFHTIIEMAHNVFYTLKKLLESNNFETSVGDEGGFAPNLNGNKQALEFIVEAIKKSGYKPGVEVFIALDIAANSFYENGKYNLESGKSLTTDELISYYKTLVLNYPIISIEDPLYEEDIEGYKKLTSSLRKIQIVGDDLFVTNKDYLAMGIKNKICNAVLIKLNQIGTISEAIETVNLAFKYKYRPIMSHRSGEVEDTVIADLAVALNIPMVKFGSITRTERTAKYNELLRIEELM